MASLYTLPAHSQLLVTPNQTAAILSATLAGPGITISSPTLTCPALANGIFTVTPGTLLGTSGTPFDINSGIILTSGRAANASGPASTLASTNNSAAGDVALDALAGAATKDACYLEFDLSVVGDTIKFNYQFGSEEYNNSTCGPYNDAFAFFISGPGIVGTENMALVPGTTIPVTVNSVNSGTPGSGYTLANCTAMGPGSPFTSYYVDNTGGTQFTYKGYTTKMSAVHKVIPCNIYHLKLAVADAGNALYDSGVFIEAGSLTTPNITGDSTVCIGSSTALSDALAGGTWSSSATGVATIGASSGIVTGVTSGTTTITYSFGIGCFVTKNFTVNPLPAVITGIKAICFGAATTLSDAVTGGTWSSLHPGIATINPVTGFVTSVGTGMATINYTIATGCRVSTTVTVNALPAPIRGVTTLCVGSTEALSDPTPGGTWSSSATGVATIGLTSGLVAGLTGGTSFITYMSPTSCSTTTVITVKPVTTGVLNIGICPGSSYTFGGINYATAGSYTHTFKSGPCDSIVTLNLSINPVSATDLFKSVCQGEGYTIGSTYYNKTGKYTYRTTNVYGCDSIVTLNLLVAPTPAPPTFIDPVFYCQFEPSKQLTATGSDINWYLYATGSGGSKVAPTPSTLNAGTISYYVSQTVGGCESPRDTLSVIIYPAPNAGIISSNNSLCKKDTLSFSGIKQANSTYQWSFPERATIIKGTSTMPGPLTVKFDTTGYQQVKLTVRVNETQCANSDSMKVHVVVAPEIEMHSQSDVCLGDTVVIALGSITPGITKYVWDFGDATILSATDGVTGGPYKVMWVNSGVHAIQVYGMVNELCRSKNEIDTIMVHKGPEARILVKSDANVCTGDSILFATADYDYENKYVWTPEHSFRNLNQQSIYGRIENAGFITLTVTDPFGCEGINRVLIEAKPCCTIAFPNAFTPNGDGKNDLFRPITPGNHAVHEFRIVNRWGQTVFETLNEKQGWDGTFNGVPQDLGTYFYYMKYECDGHTMENKGDVTLIR